MSVLFNSSEFYNYFYSRYINVGFFGTHLDFLLESWYGCDNNLFDFFTVSNERELINALPTGNRNQCRRKNLIITDRAVFPAGRARHNRSTRENQS